ncbi:MAG: hypothetical protein WBA53_04075 [Burkholderiaceae bacterium]
MKQDRSGLEPDHHSSCEQRLELQLHRIQVDQFDSGAGSTGVGYIDDRDGGQGSGVGERVGLHSLRNSR